MSQLPKTLTGKTTVWLSNKYYGPADIVRDGTKAIGKLSYCSHDMSPNGWMAIGETEVTINFYPMDEIVDKRVKGLREEQKKTMADAQLKSTQIEREIQSLLAITNEVSA